MATLIATADGNLTGSTTFAAAETGTSALAMIRANLSSISTAQSQTSPTFTVTNGKVIDGVMLWLWLSSGTLGTSTFKVDLQKGGVSQASVTVNQTDLPPATLTATAPVFFKFTSTATGDGGSNWTLVLTTVAGGGGSATFLYSRNSATTNDFTRALRTTTTGAPAAADDLYVIGEFTGAGTHNSRTVTMDSTAATAYGNGVVNSTSVNGGGVRVGAYGTLSYGTTASTNYVLRINGDLEVYWNGALNIGASGSEIPRTSTAVLEFQQTSASGDFGLYCREFGTVNIAGLSRTSGKNVVSTKLTSNVASSSALTSSSNSSLTAAAALDSTGLSVLANGLTDTAVNTTHEMTFLGATLTNTTQVATIWIAQGSGTNNRFVRLLMGNASALASVSNGFYSDIDLQAGTAGTVTALGNGTATSVSITPSGRGYLIRMIGKVSTASTATTLHVVACSAAGTTSYLGNASQCFVIDHFAVVTASSLSDTTFNVNDDTGWLSGDAVCVASTTRTAGECENFILNANAGASSFTTAEHPFGIGVGTNIFTATHSGTSPTQAEVGLLTRNVKIRSTSTTLATFVYCAPLSTVNFSWAEFYYIGAAGVNKKRGIEVEAGTTANAKSITFCSLHDCINNGLYCNTNGTTSLNLTFSNNVMWNSLASVFLTMSSSLTNTDWIISNNLLMKGASGGISLLDNGGVFSGNTVVGCSTAIAMQENGTASAIGTFDGNTAHSNSSGLSATGFTYTLGTISNFTAWRNNGSGLTVGGSSSGDLYFTNLTLFGNLASSGNLNFSGDTLHINGGTIAGDASFSSALGIVLAANAACTLDIQNVDMSGTGTGLAAHTTNDISMSVTINYVQGVAINCKFGAPTPLPKTAWSKGAYIGLEKYNQTAGDHRTELTYGQLKTDTSFFNTASPSMRMTPNNASNKLESAPRGLGWKVPVSSGNTAAISLYIYKSKTGDGAAYNGNQPRLIQRANPALGQSSNVVLATYSSSTGSWNQLSANTSTATDDGAWEIIVDCDGTAGWINVDDLQVA